MGNKSSIRLPDALVDGNENLATKLIEEVELKGNPIQPSAIISTKKSHKYFGTTLFHCAGLGGSASLVDSLLRLGGDLSLKNKSQENILHCICRGGYRTNPTADHKDVRGLCGVGGSQVPVSHVSASRADALQIALTVIEDDEFIDCQDSDGRTPLHHAARLGREHLVQILLDFHASPSVLNAFNETAADEAQKNNFLTVASLIESTMVFQSEDDYAAKIGQRSLERVRREEGEGLILQDLRREKDAALVHVSQMLGVNLWTAEALLRQCKWNIQETATAYLSNPRRACELAGVPLDFFTTCRTAGQDKCMVCGFDSKAVDCEGCVSSTMKHASIKGVVYDGLLYYDSEDINFFRAIQLSCTSRRDQMKLQRLIDSLRAQLLSIENDCNGDPNNEEKEQKIIELSSCHHKFCSSCLKKYLEVKITDGEMKIKCPSSTCIHMVPIDIIELLVSPEIAKRYLHFDLSSFVHANVNIEWCPIPGCDYAVKRHTNYSDHISSAHSRFPGFARRNAQYYFSVDKNIFFSSVTCPQEHNYCFKCKQEMHDPASCDDMEKWNGLVQMHTLGVDEGPLTTTDAARFADSIWLKANTKKCPECKAPIQKNEGCNHMTCSICRYQFCWICSRNWASHNDETGGFFRCTIFEGAGAKTSSEETMAAGRRLLESETFVSFYFRARAQEDSLLLESKFMLSAERRMLDILERTSNANTDVTFIKTTFHLLIRARKYLRGIWIWSFFHAQFLTEKSGGGRAAIRADLQKAIGTLSSCCEAVSDKVARRRFRHSRALIVNAANQLQVALGHFIDVIMAPMT